MLVEASSMPPKAISWAERMEVQANRAAVATTLQRRERRMG